MVFEYQRVLVLWILVAAIKPSDVRECMGDPELDQDNPILKREQEAQVHCSFPSFFLSFFLFFQKLRMLWKLCFTTTEKLLA
jgi:hypothetical protein